MLVFNFGAQAYTRFPRPAAAEARHQDGAVPALGMNNEWCADRMHELLQHVEAHGEMLLSSPFHVVGFGFGASLAAAFAGRYGDHAR